MCVTLEMVFVALGVIKSDGYTSICMFVRIGSVRRTTMMSQFDAARMSICAIYMPVYRFRVLFRISAEKHDLPRLQLFKIYAFSSVYNSEI